MNGTSLAALISSGLYFAALADPISQPAKFSDTVGQSWLHGDKRQVLQIAEARLTKEPNDLASLLITLDYAASFMDLDRMERIIPKVRTVSAGISSDNFRIRKGLLSSTLDIYEQLLPTITPEMLKAEAYKGLIKNKPLDSLILIQALEADGLVPPITTQEQELLRGRSPNPPDAMPSKVDMLSDSSISRALATPALPTTAARTQEEVPTRRYSSILVVIVVLVASVTGAVYFIGRCRK